MPDNGFNDNLLGNKFKILGLLTTLEETGALAPLNPLRWPEFFAGSVFADARETGELDFKRPIENVVSCFEFLYSSHNNIHYDERFRKIIFDTSVVNGLSEIDGAIGSYIAGDYANSMADQYVDQAVQEAVAAPLERQLFYEIKLRGSPKFDSTGNHLRIPYKYGIGYDKSGIPKDNRSNPLDSLITDTNSSRLLWTYKFFGGAAFISPDGDFHIRFGLSNCAISGVLYRVAPLLRHSYGRKVLLFFIQKLLFKIIEKFLKTSFCEKVFTKIQNG